MLVGLKVFAGVGLIFTLQLFYVSSINEKLYDSTSWSLLI